MTANSGKIVRGVLCSEDLYFLNPPEGAVSDSWNWKESVNQLVNLIELCNSYVLNDATVISTSDGINETGLLTPLLREELASGGGFELAKQFSTQEREREFRRKRDAEYGITRSESSESADEPPDEAFNYDLASFWQPANIVEMADQCIGKMESGLRFEEFILDCEDFHADGKFAKLSFLKRIRFLIEVAKANTKWAENEKIVSGLRQQFYLRMCHVSMLFADWLEADIVLRDAYRASALSTYADFLRLLERAQSVRRKSFHPHFEKFLSDIVDKLARPVSYDYEMYLMQPSFFLEALRQVDRPCNIGYVLREIRHSNSSEFYRELNRRRLFGGRERFKADEELRRWASGNFQADGLASRIPAFEKAVYGVSVPVVSWILGSPILGVTLKAGMDAVDAVDLSLRNKRSTFVTFPEDQGGDLYVELERVFGRVGFTRGQLAAELNARQSLRSPTTAS